MTKHSVDKVTGEIHFEPVLPVQFVLPYGKHLVVDVDMSTSTEFGMTKQSFKDECDINNIMARFAVTGVVDFVNDHQGQFGDVSAIDFQNSLNTVIAAEALFEAMPSGLRDRFSNDPQKFLNFMDDPLNIDESVRLGLRVVTAAATDGVGVDPTPAVKVAPAPVASSPEAS